MNCRRERLIALNCLASRHAVIAVKSSLSGRWTFYSRLPDEVKLSPGANSNEKIIKVTVRLLDVMHDNAGCLPAVESVTKMDCHQHSVTGVYSHSKIFRSYKTLAERINQRSIVSIVGEHLDFFMKQLIMVNLHKAEVLP